MISLIILSACTRVNESTWVWETLDVKGEPTARHEAGLATFNGKIYLLGGRRINPTSVFDTQTLNWEEQAGPPIEIHHFQPVVFGDAIYILGAMTGKWPNEVPLDSVLIYYPEKDEFVFSHPIPPHRRRGGAGAVAYNNKIYLVGGITHGHMKGFKPWLDEYDPQTGDWRALPDAPHARDHFQASVYQDKLYAFAGRRTSRATGEDMELTVQHGNIFDFEKNSWESITQDLSIPTRRAGNSAITWNKQIIIGGGESMDQVEAHNEVEAFDVETQTWHTWPSLNRGRHGTGFVIVGDYLYTASGCGSRGGEPELSSIERLKLPAKDLKTSSKNVDNSPVYLRWHTVNLNFSGPATSETASENPFTSYKLIVDFKHETRTRRIRGFYAADGNATMSSSGEGNQWQVRFSPDQLGKWTYSAKLYHGDRVAIQEDLSGVETIPISNAKGEFWVIPSDKASPDFRAQGNLGISNGYFAFKASGDYWIKTGTNSPENLLAFEDFDDTYRVLAEARDGEAAAPQDIHTFRPHLQDWNTGDPSWQGDKGKALIGAMNYLSNKQMNSAYFLTLNVKGDGKDVWPYVSPGDFTRFDVSKLAQWEILFSHMQAKGIILHVVLQETENETLLDSGDTGFLSKTISPGTYRKIWPSPRTNLEPWRREWPSALVPYWAK